MCLSNVNITAKLYKDIYTKDGISYYVAPFDTIVAQTSDKGRTINDFYIVLNFNLLGTKRIEKQKDNIVDSKKKLNILIRMSKLSQKEEHQQSSDLMKFSIDLKEEDLILPACVPYVNFEKAVHVSRITLPEETPYGNYVIKVLDKVDGIEDDGKWNIQTIIPIRVE